MRKTLVLPSVVAVLAIGGWEIASARTGTVPVDRLVLVDEAAPTPPADPSWRYGGHRGGYRGGYHGYRGGYRGYRGYERGYRGYYGGYNPYYYGYSPYYRGYYYGYSMNGNSHNPNLLPQPRAGH